MGPDTEIFYYEIQPFGRDECLSCSLPECVHFNAGIDLNMCPLESNIDALENIAAETKREINADARKLRQQAILDALTSETPKRNKSEIAQDLKISRQTLYNDICCLSMEGRWRGERIDR